MSKFRVSNLTKRELETAISEAAHEYIKAHPEYPEFRNVWDFVKWHTAKQITRINGMLAMFRNM